MRDRGPVAWVVAAVFISGLNGVAAGAHEAPKVGDAAPAFRVPMLLQAPAGASADLASLRGRVVVVEFWATWCGPCIAAMPHLNEVAMALRGESVVFIAVAKDKPDAVAKFLKDHAIEAWVAIDEAGESLDAYGVRAIPTTAVIDREGRLIALTSPLCVTAEAIRDVLAGRAPTFAPPKRDTPLLGTLSPDEPEPLLLLLFRKAASDSQYGAWDWPLVTARATPLKQALALALNTQVGRIEFAEDVADARVDVAIHLDKDTDRDLALRLIESAAEAAFGLKIERELRTVRCVVLAQPEGGFQGAPADQQDGDGSSVTWGQGYFASKRTPTWLLARNLEELMHLTAVDETHLQGVYDVEARWEGDGAEAIAGALAATSGLRVTIEERPIEFVLVRRAKQP